MSERQRISFTVATFGINDDIMNEINNQIQSYYPDNPDINIESLDETSITDIRKKRNVRVIIYDDTKLEKYSDKIQEFLKRVKSKSRINDYVMIPISDMEQYTESNLEQLNDRLRPLYKNLSDKTKQEISVVPQNFDNIERVKPFFIMRIKAKVDDLYAQRAELPTEDRLTIFRDNYLKALETQDPYSRGHVDRVTLFTKALIEELKEEDELAGIKSPWANKLTQDLAVLAAQLHDIGKINIDPKILKSTDKYGRKSVEMDHLGTHTKIGPSLLIAELVKQKIHEELNETDKMENKKYKQFEVGISGHHDKVDPRENRTRADLKQNIFAQLIAVPDSFDAMASDRKYNPEPKNILDTMRDLLSNTVPNKFGEQQFTPEMAKAFIRVLAKGAGELRI